MMSSSELTTCRNLLSMLQDCNGEVADYWSKMLAHIDDQAGQIATLKTALIDDRSELISCSPSYSLWRYQNNIDRIESQDDWKPIEAKAKEELAKEYPDINWEE